MYINKFKKIVIKIGSSILIDDKGKLEGIQTKGLEYINSKLIRVGKEPKSGSSKKQIIFAK